MATEKIIIGVYSDPEKVSGYGGVIKTSGIYTTYLVPFNYKKNWKPCDCDSHFVLPYSVWNKMRGKR